MKGASRWDPVAVLALEGTLVGTLGCPYMVESRRIFRRRMAPCGAQATLYRFEEPYGYRSYCEEGHVCVLSQHSIPGYMPNRKRVTD